MSRAGHVALFTEVVPTSFAECVEEAKVSPEGYRIAGYALARSAYEILDGQVAPSVFEAAGRALADRDEEALWRWFRRSLPGCMALVPYGRKRTFMDGVETAVVAWEMCDWENYID